MHFTKWINDDNTVIDLNTIHLNLNNGDIYGKLIIIQNT